MTNLRKATVAAVLVLGVTAGFGAAEAATWSSSCATGRICLWGGSGGVGNFPVAGLSGGSSDGDAGFGDTGNDMRWANGSFAYNAHEHVRYWQNKFTTGGPRARAYHAAYYVNSSPTYCVNPGSDVGAYAWLTSYSATSGLSSLGWGPLVGC